MATQTSSKMTVADYIAWEAGNELKHEYIDGEVIEMTGGTGKHSIIKVNLTLALGGFVHLSECVIYNSDMRVRVGLNHYVYPDLSVVRGEAVYEDESAVDSAQSSLCSGGDVANISNARPRRQARFLPSRAFD